MILLFFLPSSLFIEFVRFASNYFFVYQKDMNNAITFSVELHDGKDF